MKLLILNTGGTSTKIGLRDAGGSITGETIRHSPEELRACGSLWEQFDLRREAVIGFLEARSLTIQDFDAIVSRGPAVRPLISGVYRINDTMLEDAKSGQYGNHPCAVGCRIAFELAEDNLPALTVDPPCVDEMIPVARYTGIPSIRRKSFFQALNHKAVGRRFAEQNGKRYKDMNLVICHLGSGISVASHALGKVIDVTNGLDGDAPMGLDRVGTLPAADWMRVCLSGKYSPKELDAILNGGGGMMAWLGTNNAIEIESWIAAGDTKAAEVYDAMAFQVAKGVGAAAAALGGRPDAILFTGGLAHSDIFIGKLERQIGWLAPVHIFAGEDELQALAEGAMSALEGKVDILTY